MSPGEIAYLAMVVAALVVFALTLAFVSWFSGRSARSVTVRRTTARDHTVPDGFVRAN